MLSLVILLAQAAVPEREPAADLYAVRIHNRISRASLSRMADWGMGPEAFRVVALAQRRTDAGECCEKAGDKSSGRYYLHHVLPNDGYSAGSYAEVWDAVAGAPMEGPGVCAGVPSTGDRAAAPDLCLYVRVSERRFLDGLADMVQGPLDDARVGQVLYALGVLLHEVQDYKHREGNRARGVYRSVLQPIRSHDHVFGKYIEQSDTDGRPPDWMLAAADARTDAFLERVDRALAALPERRAFLDAVAAFRFDRDADYRPDVAPHFTMDWLFPVYAVRSPWAAAALCRDRSDQRIEP